MTRIKHIKFKKQEYESITSEDKLENLSKINIFVGANNSGKSRFMRSLFYDENHKMEFVPDDELFDYYNEQLEIFSSPENSPTQFSPTLERNAYIEIKRALKHIEFIEESKTPLLDLIRVYMNDEYPLVTVRKVSKEKDALFDKFFGELEFDENLFKYDFHKIYIPSLRGLVPLISKKYLIEEKSIDVYADRIKQDYFNGSSDIQADVVDFLMNSDINTSNAIISGLNFYEYVRNYLLGDLEQREMIRKYEMYLSETFFDNKKVVLIPKVNDEVLTVRIDEEEFKIYDLGEGIQSIILITLPLFLYLEKSKEENTNVLVFIEEPEVGLHPRLQRILIETLLDERFENYQFFFTTHSNHFIDMTLADEDISVYLFDKQKSNEETSTPKFNIEKVKTDYWNVMNKLGAMPSSVLMSNYIILVEGVTDMNHFQLYLDLYQKQLSKEMPRFKNGIHYSFLIAGGDEYKNTLKNLNDLQKEKIFLICDFDSPEKDSKRRDFFSEISFGNFHVLDVTEVENLVSKSVVINALKNTYDVDLKEDFDEESYIKSDNFFEFIVNEVIKGEIPEKFANKKGDLKEPLVRSEKYCCHNYDDLTDEAKKVARKIYEEIGKNN